MPHDNVPLFEIRDLSIRFETEGDDLRAVSGVSLRVEKGEIVGLIGQSGSGKTTLAMGTLGLLSGVPGIWKGEAFLEGQSLVPPCAEFVAEKKGRIRKKQQSFLNAQNQLLRNVRGREIAVIFQEPRAALDPYFKIGEHMVEALHRNDPSLSPSELTSKGVELLRDVGLEDAEQLWNTYPHQISGGMAQRVMIAMALSAKPKLLIADEPSTALDVTTQAKLLELFRRLRNKHGLSILLISHDIGVIQEICSRVYVLHQGVVVEEGDTVDVLQNSRHAYTRSLVQAFTHFEKNPVVASSSGTAAKVLVELRNIRKEFHRDEKSFLALDDVSLEIRGGETYALVGESGSGKSTLALSMLALQPVDVGEIFYKGEDLLRAGKTLIRSVRREIRMLFQHPEAVLNSGMTVAAILSESLESEGRLSRE